MKKEILLMVSICAALCAAPVFAANGDLLVDGRFGVNIGTAAVFNAIHVKGSEWSTSSILAEGSQNITGGGFLAYNTKTDNTLPLANDRLGFIYFGSWPTNLPGPLHPAGIASFAEGAWTSTSTPANFVWSTTASGSTTRTERLRIAGNGYVGIGTAAPQYLLDVAGVARISGTVYASDIRFKKNLAPISNPLENVLKLDGVSYEWKTDEFKEKGFPNGRHYGVIAQETEKILPDVVNTSADGTKTVAYTEIIPVLIEAIKEQQKIIEKQQKALEAQLSRIEKLEQQ